MGGSRWGGWKMRARRSGVESDSTSGVPPPLSDTHRPRAHYLMATAARLTRGRPLPPPLHARRPEIALPVAEREVEPPAERRESVPVPLARGIVEPHQQLRIRGRGVHRPDTGAVQRVERQIIERPAVRRPAHVGRSKLPGDEAA